MQETLDSIKSDTVQQITYLSEIINQAKHDLQNTSLEIQKTYASKKELNEAEDGLKATADLDTINL